MSEWNDRTPPHNIEAEQAVLGAIFLEPEAFSTASVYFCQAISTEQVTSAYLKRCLSYRIEENQLT